MDFPWSVLEIDPTDDVSSIRRAYARKLKTTRPDDDQKAFELLVQARDLALDLAAGEGQLAFLELEENTAPAETPHAETPFEIERNVVNPVVFAPPYGMSLSAALGDGESHKIEARLYELLSRHPSAIDVEIWQEILKEADQLPLLRRSMIEDEVIRGLFRVLSKLDGAWEERARLDRRQSVWAWRRWLRTEGKRIRDQRQEFGTILLAFSDLFDWESSDLAFSRALTDNKKSLILSEALRYMRKQEPLLSKGVSERYDAKGLPVFTESDLNALAYPMMQNALKKLDVKREKGRWPLDFWGKAGLFAPAYLNAYCQSKYFYAWIVLFLGWFCVDHVSLSEPWNKYEQAYGWSLLLPLLGGNVWLLLFGYRNLLSDCQHKIIQADHLKIVDPVLRWNYLRTFHSTQHLRFLIGIIVCCIALLMVGTSSSIRSYLDYKINFYKERAIIYFTFELEVSKKLHRDHCHKKSESAVMTLREKEFCDSFEIKCDPLNIKIGYEEVCYYHNTCNSDGYCLSGGKK